jgi:hypothetical protein
MKSRLKKAQNLRQALLLITAQALAIASMIWGGSLSVDAQENPVLAQHETTSSGHCQVGRAQADAQPQANAGKAKLADIQLLDFSIGKPWG